MNKPLLIPCGRGLAPDCCPTANDDIDWHTAIGGKPPPTLITFSSGVCHG